MGMGSLVFFQDACSLEIQAQTALNMMVFGMVPVIPYNGARHSLKKGADVQKAGLPELHLNVKSITSASASHALPRQFL